MKSEIDLNWEAITFGVQWIGRLEQEQVASSFRCNP
jgi:hypothetical protein